MTDLQGLLWMMWQEKNPDLGLIVADLLEESGDPRADQVRSLRIVPAGISFQGTLLYRITNIDGTVDNMLHMPEDAPAKLLTRILALFYDVEVPEVDGKRLLASGLGGRPATFGDFLAGTYSVQRLTHCESR